MNIKKSGTPPCLPYSTDVFTRPAGARLPDLFLSPCGFALIITLDPLLLLIIILKDQISLIAVL